MKQSRAMSALETVLSTAAGFGLSLFVQWLVLPWLLGVDIPLHLNMTFAAIMTVASLLRGFVMRRLFERLQIRKPLSAFMQAVIAECYRQRDVEGYDAAHDKQHDPRELSRAGAAYFLGEGQTPIAIEGQGYSFKGVLTGRALWPWRDHWKPKELRRDLVRGCALGIAAGELADSQRKAART